jgi:uncharacterized ion transporter superfamily protein YfcC
MSTTSQGTAARPFRFPSAFTILSGLTILVAALTWIIPAGQYQRAHNAVLDFWGAVAMASTAAIGALIGRPV